MYPFIKRWQKRLKLFYNKNHYVQSLLGRKRYAPLDYNQMINTPIQSLASDFCLLSMIKASREGYKIPLIIHDDITLYVHESEILKTYKRIKKIMTQWDFDFLNVNMEIECSIGRNWFKQKPLELKRKPKKCQEFA
jgi:DNA polymerase I-like protein with 3'-5' exonuclease and polymerase domains